MRIDVAHGYYTADEEGRFHSYNDEPAIVMESFVKDEEQMEGYKAWYKNGQLHRDNAPAVIRDSGEEHYYKDGVVWELS